MTAATLEHANLTVSSPQATAEWLCNVFGWHIRWQGASKDGGFTIHVGSDTSYLALYTPDRSGSADKTQEDSYKTVGGLNHLAVTVADIDATEARVLAAGFTPHMHGDYEPGKRFYFYDADKVEYEVVSYTS